MGRGGLTGPARDTAAMIAGMAPELDPVDYAFVTGALPPEARAEAIGWFREAEGESWIVPAVHAPDAARYRRIVLQVFSALDGVGLTAAVSRALANVGIACNVVAAFHHDHLFVPEGRADEALAVLAKLAAG